MNLQAILTPIVRTLLLGFRKKGLLAIGLLIVHEGLASLLDRIDVVSHLLSPHPGVAAIATAAAMFYAARLTLLFWVPGAIFADLVTTWVEVWSPKNQPMKTQ